MALVKCPECEHEVSDKASMCPQCGCPINIKKKKINFDIKEFISKNKKILILLVVVFLIFSVFSLFNGSLNNDEKLAYDCAVELKNMMKDPSSFTLYEDMYVMNRYNNDGEHIHTYVVFEYGGTNSYGAMLTDYAIFMDGEYIVDYNEDVDEGDDNWIEKVETQFVISCAKSAGKDDEHYKWIEIDTEKIKNKIGLK